MDRVPVQMTFFTLTGVDLENTLPATAFDYKKAVFGEVVYNLNEQWK